MNRLVCLLPVLLPVLSHAQNPDPIWFRNNYTKRAVRSNARRSALIYTYLPAKGQLRCAFYGENMYRNVWTNHYKEYLKEGYSYIVVRDRWMGEAVFEKE